MADEVEDAYRALIALPQACRKSNVEELLRHASLKVTTDVCMQAISPQKREAQSKLVRMVLRKIGSE
jgi:hypothetical protein